MCLPARILKMVNYCMPTTLGKYYDRIRESVNILSENLFSLRDCSLEMSLLTLEESKYYRVAICAGNVWKTPACFEKFNFFYPGSPTATWLGLHAKPVAIGMCSKSRNSSTFRYSCQPDFNFNTYRERLCSITI